MLRTGFAIMVVGVFLACVSAASSAAPIAPLMAGIAGIVARENMMQAKGGGGKRNHHRHCGPRQLVC